MTDSVESWFRQLPHDGDTPKPEEEQALIELLTGTVPARVAAGKFTSAVAREEAPAESLERLWSFINDAAEELASKHEKLIELLVEIRRLPDLTRGGQPVKADGDKVIWKDLPKFGWDIRDRWGYYESEVCDLSQIKERQKWTNLNAFAARLTISGVIDLKHMAIRALSSALEDNAQDKPFQSVNKLDIWVPAAAQWIFHAGHVIRDAREELGAVARRGPLWKGKQGFSSERWAFWKTRFAWVPAKTKASAETKKIAKEAMETMESL